MNFKNLFLGLASTTVFAFGLSSVAEAATLYVSTGSGELGTVDESTGIYTEIATHTSALLDIAVTSTGEVFGLGGGGQYLVKQQGSSFSTINYLPTNYLNALGFSTVDNMLYGAAAELGDFYRINPLNGSTSYLGNIAGFFSSGDLEFNPIQNKFFATSYGSDTDTLWSIGLDGIGQKIGDIGFQNVFGLAFADDGTLYGFTSDRQQIRIDLKTGVGTFDQTVTGTSAQIYGAASFPTITTQPVPEPASILGLFGFVAAVGLTRKKNF